MKQYTFQITMRDNPSRIIGTLTVEAKTLPSAEDSAGFILDLREVKFRLLNVTPKD